MLLSLGPRGFPREPTFPRVIIMRKLRLVCGVMLAVVAIAGLAAGSSADAGRAISDSEASALIGGAELPRLYVNATAGCNGTCGSGRCTASASYITGTAGKKGTRKDDIACTNCGAQCSRVFQDYTPE